MNVVEGRAFLLRRNWIAPGVCLGIALGGMVVGHFTTGVAEPLAYLATFLGVIFGPILIARNALPREANTTFSATERGIRIEGRGELLAEDILEAKVVPRGRGSALVELALRNKKSVTLRIGALQAQALVDVLGARRTRFRLVVSYGRRFLATFALSAVLCFLASQGNVGFALMMLPASLFYVALFAWLVGYARGRLTVGADGFTTRWLWRERFIAFKDVAAVKPRPRFLNNAVPDTSVELKNGRKMRLRTIEAPNTDEERGAESRAMLSHVFAAFDRSSRLVDGTLDMPSLLGRGGQTPRQWLSSLDALVRGGGSRYRVAAVSPEMLASLTSDPSATIEARVGAAAALVRIGDEALRTRVRISAEGCAEPELRETLLALSEARDDMATEAALSRLSR